MNLTKPLYRFTAWTASVRTTWLWNDVFAPFLLTRAAWILVGAFSLGNFQPNPTYKEFSGRGWLHSPYFLIDIWTHWDAGYYLQIIKEGYFVKGDLSTSFANVAFFPLFPYLVKGLSWLAGGWLGQKIPDSLILAIGIFLSNLLFLASAILLYRLAVRFLDFDPAAAKRSLALLFAFPVSFIFSCFYTESLFLFLTLASFTAALNRRWMCAGFLAGLLSLSRAQGILAAFCLFILYLQDHKWKIQAIQKDVLWLGISPILLVAHFYNMFRLTGNIIAPIIAQQAWSRSKYGFIEGLKLQLSSPVLDVYKIDALIVLIFLGCGIYILWKWPIKAYGVYSLLLVIVPIGTGMLISAGRFMMVIFPVILLLGQKLKTKEGFELTRALGYALQIVYFVGWVNYYWIV